MRKTGLMGSAGPPSNLIMPRKKKRGSLGHGQRGFTLIELLAVMAVIGVLSGIVVTSVSGSGEAGRDAQTQQDAGTVGSGVAQFFADQPPTEVLVQKTVTVLGESGILQESSSRWPEGYISVAYPLVFPADTATVQSVLFFNTDGELSDLTVRGLLTRFNAIDFSKLELGGYLEAAPDTATRTSQGYHNYLWLLVS